jgi:trk system potassium uptake protein TrkH
MVEYRPVIFIVGILVSILAVAMAIPAIVDLLVGNPDWQVFIAAAATTLFVGVTMALTVRTRWKGFSPREAFLMTNLAWLVIAFFGALPFAYSELNLSFTDAFFESMSGITTTGATVIVGLDTAPPGILLWRAILQWLGGIGIIVMAVAILPILQIGGMQLFRVEAADTDRVMPRAAQIAGGICAVYICLTGFAALTLWLLGMTGFEAVAHAMTSIATGGFSTSDDSLAHFENPAIHWAICVFMILGSMPFVLYLRAVRGKPGALFTDSQVRWMLSVLVLSISLTTFWIWQEGILEFSPALQHAAFNVISIMTGTGYSSADYGTWGGFVITLMFILMFTGGCAGSTTCGIKIFRFQVLYATSLTQLRRLLQPRGVFIPYYNKKPISESITTSVMSFFFMFSFSFVILAAGLGLMGLDFITSISGAASAIANVGPGLGDIIGPAGNFRDLPDGAKWILCAGMLLGRLELFTVLVLFAPNFWRN